MHNIALLILSTLRGMWRFRWLSMAAMWPVALAIWLIVIQLPPVYESRAQIFADTKSILKPLLKGLAVDSDIDNTILLMSQSLLSRPILEDIFDNTKLKDRASSAQRREALVSALREDIKIVVPSRRKPNHYSIAYADTDPEIAQDVVQALVDSLVQGTLNADKNESKNAQAFLEGKLEDYKALLEKSETELANFKRENVGLMPDEQGSYFTRLQTHTANIDLMRSKLSVAYQRRNTIRRQLESELANSSLNQSNSRVLVLEQQLNTLLLSFTEAHPDVIAIRENIAQIRRQEAQSGSASTGLINPVLQQLKLQLSQVGVEITTLSAQKRDSEKIVANLKKHVNTIPEVEVELANLTRDYAVNKKQYDELLGRYNSAQLAGGVQDSGEKVKFSILSPPQRALVPSGPPIAVFLSVGLLAAIALGIGLAFILNQINPVYCTANEASEELGMPVLGSVTLKWTEADRRKKKRSLYLLIICFLLLLIVFVGFLGLHIYNINNV